MRHALVGPIQQGRIEDEDLRFGIAHGKVAGPPSMPENADPIFPGEATERPFPDYQPRAAHQELQVRKFRPDPRNLFVGG
jgi:hypothetical protein